jgi:alanine dehydrogenase
MVKIRLLSEKDLKEVLTLREVIEAVEGGFAAEASGQIATFPVVMEAIPAHGAGFGIKSSYIPGIEALGLKVGGFWPQPAGSPIPAHFALIYLADGATGKPLAFMDGNLITTWRTGAAGAVAAKYLARPDASRVGVIGAGVQGQIQVLALREFFPIAQVRIWSRSPESVARYVETMAGHGLAVEPAESPREAATGADVIITATPARKFLVNAAWVAPGTHINAIGADSRGKQEIDPALFPRAKVVVDKLSQCRELGDLQHPLQQRLMTTDDVHAELGQVVSGARAGRESPDEITLFDSTGVSFQDVVTAELAYRRAVEARLGFDFAISD